MSARVRTRNSRSVNWNRVVCSRAWRAKAWSTAAAATLCTSPPLASIWTQLAARYGRLGIMSTKSRNSQSRLSPRECFVSRQRAEGSPQSTVTTRRLRREGQSLEMPPVPRNSVTAWSGPLAMRFFARSVRLKPVKLSERGGRCSDEIACAKSTDCPLHLPVNQPSEA